jgi:hypothetical protein
MSRDLAGYEELEDKEIGHLLAEQILAATFKISGSMINWMSV